MELLEHDFYAIWNEAQHILRNMFVMDGKGIVIFEKVMILEEGNVQFYTLKDAFEALKKCQEGLHECLCLLERVLRSAEWIRKSAREGKIEGGRIEDVESRLKHIETLFNLGKEVDRFLTPAQEGRLDQLLRPDAFHTFRTLLEACTKGFPAAPIHVIVTYVI